MKTRLILSTALTITLLLTAALPTFSAAAPVVTNEQVPFESIVFIPCANGGAGEGVLIAGELHVLSVVVMNAAGGLTVQSHYQPMGISGVGLITGDQYRATGVTSDRFTEAADAAPYESTYINNFRIIGAGPGNNYLVHAVFHVTVNADGTVTTVVDQFSSECR